MGTLDTGVPTLDARLKQPDLLATTEYPEAYFIATHFQFDAAGGVNEVRGEFILRGVSEPLSLVARSFACRHDEMLERDVCGGDFAGDLKRSDFGANFGEPSSPTRCTSSSRWKPSPRTDAVARLRLAAVESSACRIIAGRRLEAAPAFHPRHGDDTS